MNRVKTPAQEFSRLVIEYNEGKKDSPTRQEAWNLIADFALEHCDTIIRSLSTPTAAGGEEAIEPPISQLMRDDGEPEWKQINALFLRNDINAFPIRLRDELSTMLAWARYGERAALSTAVAAEPVAWQYEWLGSGTGGRPDWGTYVSRFEPDASEPGIRNIRPLVFASPPSETSEKRS